MAAYNLLEKYVQENYDIHSHQALTIKDGIIFDVNILYQRTSSINNEFEIKYQCEAFLQYQHNQDIKTIILNIGAPISNSLQKNANSVFTENLRHQFAKYNDIRLFQYKHSSHIVCLSYIQEIKQFALTTKGYTVLFNEDHQQQQQFDQNGKRAYELVYFLTNQILSKMSLQQLLHFQKDLIGRSLVGVSCYKTFQWFTILEHYAEQKILHPSVVTNFLLYYGLYQVQQLIRDEINFEELKKLEFHLYNSPIEDFNDMNIGQTIYFWNQNHFLGSYFVESKHYQLINQIKFINTNACSPLSIVRQFHLSQQEEEFYLLYIDIFQKKQNSLQNTTFSTLTSMIFNSIHRKQDRFDPKLNRLPLSFCLNPSAILIVPLFVDLRLFKHMKNIFQQVSIIENFQQLNCINPITCYNQILSPEDLENQIHCLKNLKFHTQIVALLDDVDCIRQNNSFLPFSFDSILNYLEQYLDDENEFNKIFQILLKYTQIEFKQFQTLQFINIKCSKYFQEESKQILRRSLQIKDSKDLFNHLKENRTNCLDDIDHYEECNQIVNQIEKLLQRKIYKFFSNYRPSYKYQMSIKLKCWQEIEDFIVDSLEIVKQRDLNNAEIQVMFSELEGQFFNKQNTAYYKLFNFDSFDPSVYELELIANLIILIPGGLVILCPQGISQNQGIPLVTLGISPNYCSYICQELNQEMKILSAEDTEVKSFSQKEFKIENKNWQAYIIKMIPLKFQVVNNIL